MVRMLKPPGPGVRTRGEMAKPLSALKWKAGSSAKAKTYRPTNTNGPMYGSVNLSIAPAIQLRINLSICPTIILPTDQYINLPISQPNYQSTNMPTYRIIALTTYRSTNLLNSEDSPVRRSDIEESTYRSINLEIYSFTHLARYRPKSINLPIYRPISLPNGKMTKPLGALKW